MYIVSRAYKQAVKSPSVMSELRINIDGTDYNENNVLQGSFSINNQCSDSSDVTLGCVYVGELSVTFLKNVNLNRNTWKGRIIKPYYRLNVGNSYEELPLGVFEVDEALYSASGVEVKAYDYMSRFDKNIVLNQSSGFAYDFLRIACNNCNVQLGMSQAEVEALPNGSQALTYYSQNDVKTYRDLVYRVAQILGGFATMDRLGRLVVRTYPSSSLDSVDIYHRTSSSKFSDYVTSYTGMSYVSLSDNYTHYHGLPDDTGLTMNLGANPFLQGGTKAYIDGICNNILNAISNIVYTPCEVKVWGNPAYDLGDVIEFTDGLAGTTSRCCVMAYNFINHNGFEIKGYGSNPALSTARSKVDKNISGLMDRVKDNEVIFTSFENADEMIIEDGDKEEIIAIRFASNKATYVIFQAEILCSVNTSVSVDTYTDMQAKVYYISNGSEILTYHPIETWDDGKHILSLMYVIPVDTNIINNWQVLLEVNGGSVTIPAENCRATIYGQGLVASDEWDGIIDLSEMVRDIDFTNLTVDTITETVDIRLQNPIWNRFAETVSDLLLGSMVVETITDDFKAYITEQAYINQEYPPTYDDTAVEYTDNAYRIISGSNVPQELIRRLIDVDEIADITSLTVDGNNVTLQFSDDGETWYSYVNNTWIESTTEMTVNQASSLSFEDWSKLTTTVLWVKVSLNVANSSLAEFMIEYVEGVGE